MTDRRSTCALLGATLLLAACGQSADRTAATDRPAPADQAAPASAPAADTGLAAYVGKYPFDKVDGVAWTDHPAVKAGLAATVTDAKIRQTIAADGATAAPIEMYEGKVMSWACEAHNCGPHQWAVLIDPASGATDACYHDEDVDAGRSHWFLAGGTEEWRDGNCQLGQD